MTVFVCSMIVACGAAPPPGPSSAIESAAPPDGSEVAPVPAADPAPACKPFEPTDASPGIVAAASPSIACPARDGKPDPACIAGLVAPSASKPGEQWCSDGFVPFPPDDAAPSGAHEALGCVREPVSQRWCCPRAEVACTSLGCDVPHCSVAPTAIPVRVGKREVQVERNLVSCVQWCDDGYLVEGSRIATLDPCKASELQCDTRNDQWCCRGDQQATCEAIGCARADGLAESFPPQLLCEGCR